MKLKLLIFNFSFLILTACGVTKPVATTHTERIEQHVMPVAVGADTIEITLSHTDNILHTEDLSHTECTDNTEYAVATPAEDRLINDFEQSEKSNSVSSVGSVRNKNSSVRNKNSEGVKSVQICRAPSCAARERIEEKEELKSELSVQSVGDEKSRSEKKSVYSVYSVRDKNNSVRDKNNSVRNKNSEGVKSVQICRAPSCAARERIEEKELKNQSDLCNLWETPHSEGVNSVRISSTRGVNFSRHETDTTSTLRITLRPDTVFVPYTNHIRSDTIVVPDRICKTKLQKTQTANVLLILILIAIFIYSLRS